MNGADDDRVQRLHALDTCAVSDALDVLGLAGAVLGLHSVTGRHRLAGRAMTIDLVAGGGGGGGRRGGGGGGGGAPPPPPWAGGGSMRPVPVTCSSWRTTDGRTS